MEDFIFKFVMPAVFIPIGMFMLFLMLVWVPFHLYDESQCLKAGYPKTSTSVFLDGYCMNLEGSVTVQVKSLGEQ